MNIEKNFNIAKNAIKLAGVKVLNFYGKLKNTKYKQNNSPLTQADLASNRILLKRLKISGIPVLSEEGQDDLSRLNSDKIWIIDPLDGTKDFIQESGEFTIMIALVEKNVNNFYRPILGLIYQPVKKILYYATKDRGAWQELDDKQTAMRVSRRADWSDVIMLTSRNHSTDIEKNLALDTGINKIKVFGSSLKACLVACGEGDFNFNPAPHTWEWDVCASDLIVYEAGGRFSDCRGDLINYNKKDPRNNNGYLASNVLVYEKVINRIKLCK
ncbi:MAG: 3'(2'),5'-bisphosphate nucleotidase CysQ [Patescibacteria group bacterium]|nr:3'(2'),5'-bisphosphate nucleotidase CysQ [Patescibacteria group bacterium]